MKEKIPKIAIAAILSYHAVRQRLAGMFAYLGTVHRWNLHVLRERDESIAFFADPDALRDVDGVLYMGTYDEATFPTLASLDCPVVVMENDGDETAETRDGLFVVRSDEDGIAKAALDAFLGFGRYRTFAFVGTVKPQEWSRRRESAFRKAVAAEGLGDIAAFPPAGADIRDEKPLLEEFLRSLDYPAAVLAANDPIAVAVVESAKSAGVSVPGKVSVMGIDNDPFICDSVMPGISSIEPDFHGEGRLAASLLDQMLRSRSPLEGCRVYSGAPRLVLRESTPFLPPAASVVSRAREFIRQHATEGIAPADVAAHLGISRTLLDLRFRETQKTTVGRLITDAKLAEVERRLRLTSISIGAIHDFCGFANANALKNLFKARYGMSMRAWRAAHRAQRSE